ncbi:MAG TPA: glyoxylate/hydroxypyruvate reductase A [Sulfurospirillum arcachonense]|nr:glyoxylate/hydroxypyruvate reductase A [Sulfurospirillum arcachonense]
MNPIVPFVQSLTNKNASNWLIELQSSMPNINICHIEELSESERKYIEVAIVAKPNPIDLLTLPNLRWVQSLWAGVEKLIDELPNKQISIVRLIDPQLGETMAEAVLAWTLYLHRNMPIYKKQQSSQEWIQHDVTMASEQTIGILGLGHLGQKAAKRLLDNGFNVVGWNSGKNLQDIETFSGEDGLLKVATLSDILVILLPLTPQTSGLLGNSFFSQLKHGASLINFARADIIDVKALEIGLETRQIKHAVLDVFLQEPLERTDKLWRNPHVTVLPHISAPTNKHTASQVVAKNIRAFFDSNKIPQSISREIGY